MTIASTEVPGIDALSKRLRMARIGADLDQAQIAERLGVGRNTVSNWETGRSEPSATHFVQWSLVCGVPLEWLGAVNAETAPTEVETVSDPGAPRRTRTPNLLIRSQMLYPLS